ncbi:protein SSUH2 homolog isoform X2 [Apostichopus japonicus]|uniref:protein SSUH2 homolog isoform X2 n=1 Tax=Stichopus japonicus TaxID=307972 RepID=UPI003AB65EDC
MSENQRLLGEQQPKMYQGGQQNYPPPAAGYPQGGGGYPQGGGGYPQGGGGYPQGGGGYPQGGAPGYQQGGNPPQPAASGYPQSQPQPGAGYPGGMPASGGGGPEEPSYKGDVPDEDVEADPNNAQSNEPQPTAPPASAFDAISGYNQMDAALPPPSYQDALSSQGPPQRQDLPPAPSVNDEQAKEALLQFVSEKCCYGTGAARNMKINDIVQSSAFHYKLETFTEKRLTKHAFEPYRGQVIDSAANGPAPGPWNIAVNPPTLFQAGKMEVEVPHTASIKPCHDCHGAGFRRCHVCLGRGRTRCNFCHGTGRVQDFGHHHNIHHDHHHGRHGGHHGGHHHHHHGPTHRPCTSCMGLGRNRCFSCNGHGQNRCTTCQGTSNLKTYIKLIITWTNNVNDSIVERTGLPDELIRGVSGQVAFKEELPLVWPVGHFQDQAINNASRELVERHKNSFPLERILMQRHQITIVPVGEVHSQWNDKSFNYFVYGFENKVHAPDYPTKCCCCTIL